MSAPWSTIRQQTWAPPERRTGGRGAVRSQRGLKATMACIRSIQYILSDYHQKRTRIAAWRYCGHFHWHSDERRVSPIGVRGTWLSKAASRQSQSGVPLLVQEVSGSPHRDLTVHLRQRWRSKFSSTLARVSRPYRHIQWQKHRHFRCHVTRSIPPLHAIDHPVGEGHDTRS